MWWIEYENVFHLHSLLVLFIWFLFIKIIMNVFMQMRIHRTSYMCPPGSLFPLMFDFIYFYDWSYVCVRLCVCPPVCVCRYLDWTSLCCWTTHTAPHTHHVHGGGIWPPYSCANKIDRHKIATHTIHCTNGVDV